MENLHPMQTLEIEEICYTENSNSTAYCEAVNEKVRDGWVLFGPREIDSGWIKQYYVKLKKSNNKTTVKEQ